MTGCYCIPVLRFNCRGRVVTSISLMRLSKTKEEDFPLNFFLADDKHCDNTESGWGITNKCMRKCVATFLLALLLTSSNFWSTFILTLPSLASFQWLSSLPGLTWWPCVTNLILLRWLTSHLYPHQEHSRIHIHPPASCHLLTQVAHYFDLHDQILFQLSWSYFPNLSPDRISLALS